MLRYKLKTNQCLMQLFLLIAKLYLRLQIRVTISSNANTNFEYIQFIDFLYKNIRSCMFYTKDNSLKGSVKSKRQSI